MTHLKRRHMDVMDSDMIAEVGMYKYVKSLGQKVHKCDSCGKTYSQASILKKHINAVHNGIKDHKCDTCGLKFSQAGHLKRHINSIHINSSTKEA